MPETFLAAVSLSGPAAKRLWPQNNAQKLTLKRSKTASFEGRFFLLHLPFCANAAFLFCSVSGPPDRRMAQNCVGNAKQGEHTIKEYGVDEKYFLETLDEMTEQAFNDQCTGANPRYPLMSELKEIYLKAYYGEGNIPESGKAKEKKEENKDLLKIVVFVDICGGNFPLKI